MKRISEVKIWKVIEKRSYNQEDYLVAEEPQEIRIAYGPIKKRQQKSISVTMRTPGNDFELATGFLFTEGIIRNKDQILRIEYVPTLHSASENNIVRISLTPEVELDLEKLERHFYTTSSCGVCGKTSIEAIYANEFPELGDNHLAFDAKLLRQLPHVLLKKQALFESTGGLHAAALFDASGNVKWIKEDIGRHNAVDKLIGAAFLENKLPLSDYLILVSGRAGFELIQKSLMAGIPVLAAVGAPSSLAMELAQEAGMTLVGFLKKDKFNIYTHPERIKLEV